MKHLLLTALFASVGCGSLCAAEPPAPHGAVPTDAQVKWLRMEWYAFVHFGLNTYTDREWGYGDESPTLFNPTRFDANAIVRTFRKAGMSGMIYTAKHHDGWCSWPTKTTQHSIKASPWKDGRGDVVKEFALACKKHGIAFGTYLSPWDRNCADYGRPGYLKVYYAQVKELLTRYGDIFEIWFDGANGGDGFYGGAREQRNIGNASDYYDFARLVKMIRRLQPNCIIWGAGGLGDAEWGGSEKGHVKYPLSNVRTVNGRQRWVSFEGDTPINKRGWFWHPGQQDAVKTPEHLMQVYLDSVGRGANLILNVAPNREGRLDEADVVSLQEFGRMRRQLLAKDYALGAKAVASEVRGADKRFSAAKLTDGDIESYWCPNDGTTTATLQITLPEATTFDIIRLREQIRLGQRVESFEIDALIEGAWKTVDAGGKSIGHQVMRKLDAPITTDRLRVRITASQACPCISELSLLRMPKPSSARKEQVQDTGLSKSSWACLNKVDNNFMDGDPATATRSRSLTVDMGSVQRITAFSYLPPEDDTEHITERYTFLVSVDNKNWQEVAEGEFSNMRANPIEQRVNFEPVQARYWRFSVKRTLGGGKAGAVAEINIYPAK